MPLIRGKDLCKKQLIDRLLETIGIGWAPMPEWGCPEGIDDYMIKIESYAESLAGYRGCRSVLVP
jgi:hypothetical protein